MNQPIKVIARATDPETSREAADELERNQTKLQRSVAVAVRILEDHGPLSDFQIRDLWPGYWGEAFSYTLPCKARLWAWQGGLVSPAGHGKHRGRRVQLWQAGGDGSRPPTGPSRKELIAALREVATHGDLVAQSIAKTVLQGGA